MGKLCCFIGLSTCVYIGVNMWLVPTLSSDDIIRQYIFYVTLPYTYEQSGTHKSRHMYYYTHTHTNALTHTRCPYQHSFWRYANWIKSNEIHWIRNFLFLSQLCTLLDTRLQSYFVEKVSLVNKSLSTCTICSTYLAPQRKIVTVWHYAKARISSPVSPGRSSPQVTW